MVVERKGEAFEHGEGLTVLGRRLAVGDTAPDFLLHEGDGEAERPVRLEDTSGSVRLVNAVNSLHSSICDAETRRLDRFQSALSAEMVVYTVSMDPPAEQARWRDSAGVSHSLLSARSSPDFGPDYGLLIKERSLLQRAVFVIDCDGSIVHAEYIRDQAQAPNYTAAVVSALGGCISGSPRPHLGGQMRELEVRPGPDAADPIEVVGQLGVDHPGGVERVEVAGATWAPSPGSSGDVPTERGPPDAARSSLIAAGAGENRSTGAGRLSRRLAGVAVAAALALIGVVAVVQAPRGPARSPSPTTTEALAAATSVASPASSVPAAKSPPRPPAGPCTTSGQFPASTSCRTTRFRPAVEINFGPGWTAGWTEAPDVLAARGPDSTVRGRAASTRASPACTRLQRNGR